MTGLSVKSIAGVTFVGKYPWLVYIICLTYCFPFSSAIATLFFITSCIFKLKDFKGSNIFLTRLFVKLCH